MEQNQNNNKLFFPSNNQTNKDSKEKKNINYENNSKNPNCPLFNDKESGKKILFGDFTNNNENLFGNESKSLFNDKEKNDFFKGSRFFSLNLFEEKDDKSLLKKDKEIVKSDKNKEKQESEEDEKEKEKKEEEESSSSNYHPENENPLNFFAELAPYMSSDSDIDEEKSDDRKKNDKNKKKNSNLIHKKRKKKKKKEISGNINDISSGYNSDVDSSYSEEENSYNNKNNSNKPSKGDQKEKVGLFDDLNLKKNDGNAKNNDKDNNKKNENSSNSKSDSNSCHKKEEELDQKKIIIEFSKKFKNNNNPLSINYYTKETKLENMNDILQSNLFFEFKNTKGCFLIYNENKDNLCFYNSLTKIKKEKTIYASNIVQLHNDYFIIIDSYNNYKIIILHFNITKNDFIIDQMFDLPEEKELNIHGPFAPYLSCLPLNESFIIFHWNTANNFYIYKNKSSKKDEFKFENFDNIELDKKANVYTNTELEKLLKINKNDFLVFAISDQRPASNSIFEAFMRGNAKHKETTYIAVYSYDKENDKFFLKKYKVNYEKNSGYSSDYERCILRERFFVYSGDDRNKKMRYIQIFDLKVMQIITVIKSQIYILKYFKSKNNNNILFLNNSSLKSMKQYIINKNGHLKQIGKIKYKNVDSLEIKENGILYKGDYGSFCLFIHE